MKLVFIHQNFPGQFKHLAPHYAADPKNTLVAIAKAGRPAPPNIRLLTYRPKREAGAQTHPYLKRFEDAVLHGQEVAARLNDLKREGFVPDLILGHAGWGETLFAKDVFPTVPLLSYCEYYYRAQGSDADFDPAKPPTIDDICRCRIHNGHHLLAIEAAERGVAPTQWQRHQFPALVRDKIAVIHDGIDVDTIRPDPAATYTLPDGTVLTRNDEIVTYVARNFEPHRGFATLMRGIAEILPPPAQLPLPAGGRRRGQLRRAPASGRIASRAPAVRGDGGSAPRAFPRQAAHAGFLEILKVSSAHIYLTQPFVLSWSVLEAMAAGCAVIASDTAPVREVIRHGENGILFDFFKPAELADRIDDVLNAPRDYDEMRRLARKTIVSRYALADSLRKLDAMIGAMIGPVTPARAQDREARADPAPQAAHAS